MANDESESDLKQEGKYLIVDGTKYCRYPYTLWFSADGLTVIHNLEKKTGKALVTSIAGSTTVDSYGIEVIGLKGKATKTLMLGIHTDNPEFLENYAKEFWATSNVDRTDRPLTDEIPAAVSLWFSAGDAELRSKDEWYIDLTLHESAIAEIASLIVEKRAASLNFGAKFATIYTDDEFGPVGFRKRFGVRRGKYGSSEMAHGLLVGLSIRGASASLVQPKDTGPVTDDSVDDQSVGTPLDILEPLNQLNRNVVVTTTHMIKATSFLKWIVVAVAIIALALIVKH